MITSETRASRGGEDGGGWLIGVSLLHNDAKLNREIGAVTMLAPAAGVRNRVDEATLFGEATIAPLPRLAISADGRVTYSWLSGTAERSEEHTSELQSLMRTSYAVFCLKKKNKNLIVVELTRRTVV